MCAVRFLFMFIFCSSVSQAHILSPLLGPECFLKLQDTQSYSEQTVWHSLAQWWEPTAVRTNRKYMYTCTIQYTCTFTFVAVGDCNTGRYIYGIWLSVGWWKHTNCTTKYHNKKRITFEVLHMAKALTDSKFDPCQLIIEVVECAEPLWVITTTQHFCQLHNYIE